MTVNGYASYTKEAINQHRKGNSLKSKLSQHNLGIDLSLIYVRK